MSPEKGHFRSLTQMQSAEIIVKKPKSTCLLAFVMMTKDVAL